MANVSKMFYAKRIKKRFFRFFESQNMDLIPILGIEVDISRPNIYIFSCKFVQYKQRCGLKQACCSSKGKNEIITLYLRKLAEKRFIA